jgi:hypothetical protein
MTIWLFEEIFQKSKFLNFRNKVVWEFSLFNIGNNAFRDFSVDEFADSIANFLNDLNFTFSSAERKDESPRKSKLLLTVLGSVLMF